MAQKVKATIERGSDNKYSVYTDFVLNGYGLMGYGDTVEEAKNDFIEAYNEACEMLLESGKTAIELEFVFYYDIASFLDHYSKMLSKSGLEAITGINQKQLGHYYNGNKHPRPETVKKIQQSIYAFAGTLQQVRFID